MSFLSDLRAERARYQKILDGIDLLIEQLPGDKTGPKKENVRNLYDRRYRRATVVASRDDHGLLTCPECGYKNIRSQSMGAHRRSKHGVVGEFNKNYLRYQRSVHRSTEGDGQNGS